MSSSWQLLTERLRLRPYRADDAAAMFAVFGDPEVMRYSMSGADPTPAATEVRVRKLIDHQERCGFSLWVVEDRASGAILGDCGLKHLEDGPEIEVGYRFAKSHWGKGYATEAAAASVRHGFVTLALPRIVAVVEPPNTASRQVLEKIGLRFEKSAHYYGRTMNYFSAERAAFLAQSSRGTDRGSTSDASTS
jgi:ribosomal-protein-alanine N-acetyltransferase